MQKYFTYIARCRDNSLYTGSTNNAEERERRHNDGLGSRYTRTRLSIKIVYVEEFQTRQEAMKRERQIKGWARTKKENLIKQQRIQVKKLMLSSFNG